MNKEHAHYMVSYNVEYNIKYIQEDQSAIWTVLLIFHLFAKRSNIELIIYIESQREDWHGVGSSTRYHPEAFDNALKVYLSDLREWHR